MSEPQLRDRWLGIELRHFAALAAIAEENSFRAAAERLGYVQSAISRQIAHLETLTGTRLVERAHGPKPVYLTAEGEILHGHAEEILATIDAAKTAMYAGDHSAVDEVRVGVPGVATRIVARAVPAFGRLHPEMRVVMTEALSEEAALELVRKGRVELAFARIPPEPGPLAAQELLHVPWTLVLPAAAGIDPNWSQPTLARILSMPLIGFVSPRMEPWTDPKVRAAVEARLVMRCQTPETAQSLVGAGAGAAILPRLAVQDGDPQITTIDLDDLLEPMVLGLVWLRHATQSHAAVQFRQLVQRVCATMARPAPATGRFNRRPAAEPTDSALG